MHIVGVAGIFGDDAGQALVSGYDHVLEGEGRWVGDVVGGKEGEKFAGDGQRLRVVFGDEVDVAGDPGVGVGSSEFFGGDLLAGGGLDHAGAGDEHLGASADLDHEIGDRRRVDSPAGTGAGDDRNLRDHAGEQGVVVEDGAIAAEGIHPLLNTGSAAVVDPDHRGAALQGIPHDVDDLLRVHLADGTACAGEVLGEGEDRAAVDQARSGQHPVTGDLLSFHAELAASVFDEALVFQKRAGVVEGLEPLPRRHLAGPVLFVDLLLPTCRQYGRPLGP